MATQIETTTREEDAAVQTRRLTPKEAALSLLGVLLLLAFGGFAGYGIAQTQFSLTHPHFEKTTSVKAISINVYVVKIDGNATYPGYKDLQIGDPILIKLSADDLSWFQTSSPRAVECLDNGLVLTPDLEGPGDGSNANYNATCGNIHVVLFPPL